MHDVSNVPVSNAPVFLNPHFHDLLSALVFPNVFEDHLIPGSADLSASVETLKALETNHDHDITEYQLR